MRINPPVHDMMSNQSGHPVSSRADASQSGLLDECQIARDAGVNLLLIGPRHATDGVVSALWPAMKAGTWHPGQSLELPAGGGTLILHDVGHLDREDQRRLLRWLDAESGRAQVVSTSPSPLLLRMASGAFLEALYYRLNTICVNANDD
jgi:hypothetical protein